MNMKYFFAAIAAVPLLVSVGAAAGEKGTFESAWAGTDNYQTIELGEGRSATAGSISGSSIITKGGGPFPEGSALTWESVVYVEQGPDGIDLRERGVVTDAASGDKYFYVNVRTSEQLEEGEGRSKITGGTGKYEGLTADCTYHVTYLPGHRLVGTERCEWEKP